MDRLGYKCLHFGYIGAYDGYTCALFHPQADTNVSAVGGTSTSKLASEMRGLQQKDSKLNHDYLDLNDHFYKKAISRRVRILTRDSYPRVRILTLRFLP